MYEIERGTARHRTLRRERVEELARRQAGLVSRSQLSAAGVTRDETEAEVQARRWRPLGRQCLSVVPDGSAQVELWRALFEIGSLAVLDGPSALIASGLRNIESAVVHVAVPKSAHRQRSPRVVVHETRRFREEDVLRDGSPRVRPAVAAVHAALWVPSEKQAALFVLGSVQQRIVKPDDFAAAAQHVRRDPRLRLLRQLVREALGGIQSIGESDFARMCQKRRFPPPTRQVLRQSPTGRVYLDVFWDEYKVTVEIDGIHHLDPRSVIQDSLKQNAMMLEGVVTLRIPLSALREDPEPFLDQVNAALRAAGWPGP